MITFHLSITDVGIYLAILLRLSVVLFMTPVFSSSQIPMPIKAGITLAMATMLYPILHAYVRPLVFEPAPLSAVVAGEILFGMVLSLSINLLLSAVQLAGELISFQMGFGFAQVVDPINGSQISVISRWLQMVALMILLTSGGHHLILRAVVESFRTVPVGGIVLNGATLGATIELSKQLFVIAIKIAAPVMVVLLLAHISLGLISKFAPQMNMMTASFPLTIVLGLFFTAISFEMWGEMVGHLVTQIIRNAQTLIR